MTQRDELLDCPFCGLDVTDDEGCFPSNFDHTKWEVRCGNPSCFAHDPVDESREAAIERWNRRAIAAQPALLSPAPSNASNDSGQTVTQPAGLPELPEGMSYVEVFNHSDAAGNGRYYTADQMRTYAAQAAGADAKDAARWRAFCDEAEREGSNLSPLLDDALNMGAGVLDMRYDAAISEQAGAEGKE